MNEINKRFPADSRIAKIKEESFTTFLSDKKINAELYAYFQSKAYPCKNADGKAINRVSIHDLDTVKVICEKIGVKSRQTYYNYLKHLKEKEYIIEDNGYYILNNPESFFFDIPLSTLQFLMDVVKDPVIKTYIYLGHQLDWVKTKGQDYYDFTLLELGDHIGIDLHNNHLRDFVKINNYLTALENHHLIELLTLYDKKGLPYKRLTKVNLQIKDVSKNG